MREDIGDNLLPDTGIRLQFVIDHVGERLDKALAAAHPDLSRMQWQRLIKEKLVLVNGVAVKASYRLEGVATVTAAVPPQAPIDLEPEEIPLDIVYQDDDIILLNKAAGMVVHPGAVGETGTLVHALLWHFPELRGVGETPSRPGIVHRLDKDTSGLILVAKNDRAMRYMQAQFMQRTIEKQYVALVDGHIDPEEALIDAPIGRNPKQRKKMAVIPPGSNYNAKPAQTRYRALTYYDDFTFVECDLLTGRTHQIRVHLAYIGSPIVGDKVYGRRKQQMKLSRHFLHAARLTFNRPSDGERLTFEGALSAELQAVLDKLNAS